MIVWGIGYDPILMHCRLTPDAYAHTQTNCLPFSQQYTFISRSHERGGDLHHHHHHHRHADQKHRSSCGRES